MKVIYTESAKHALEAFKERQVKVLEEHICSRKYVFGDDVVEITASDILEASEYRSSLSRHSRQRGTAKTIMQMYVVFGVLMTLGGLFYRDLLEKLSGNPVQLILVVTGTAVTLTGYTMLTRIRTRQQEEERIERIENDRTRNV